MKTVTQKINAWITPHSSISPTDLLEGSIAGLVYSSHEMTSMGWTLAGEAEITLHLVDEKTLVDNKVEALRAEAANIRAEATAKVTQIEGQIQQLLAIEYRPS